MIPNFLYSEEVENIEKKMLKGAKNPGSVSDEDFMLFGEYLTTRLLCQQGIRTEGIRYELIFLVAMKWPAKGLLMSVCLKFCVPISRNAQVRSL